MLSRSRVRQVIGGAIKKMFSQMFYLYFIRRYHVKRIRIVPEMTVSHPKVAINDDGALAAGRITISAACKLRPIKFMVIVQLYVLHMVIDHLKLGFQVLSLMKNLENQTF